MLYQITKRELEKLLAVATQVGFQRALETVGKKPRVISQNKAHIQFCKSRVQTWIKDGRIIPTTNGNGRTSTIFLDYAKLLELDASEKIIIHKSDPR